MRETATTRNQQTQSISRNPTPRTTPTHLAKLPQPLHTTHLLGQQRQLDDMETVFVQFVCFTEVLLLHLVADGALFAVGAYERASERVRRDELSSEAGTS
jgi:hypothetical protein